MNLVLSLILAIAIAYYGKEIIRKKSSLCYIGITVTSILLIAIYAYLGTSESTYLNRVPLTASIYTGALASAFFIIIMYLGAVPKGHWLLKNFMGIRGQLSIIASILIIVHNVSMKLYVKTAMLEGGTTALIYRLMGITTVLMYVLLIPLFLTSFMCIRKKMKAKSWKKLQRLAYPFYALIYLHVMIGNVPTALSGDVLDIIDVLVYTIVFGTYIILKIKKNNLKNKNKKK